MHWLHIDVICLPMFTFLVLPTTNAITYKVCPTWEVVVAQLVERSLPIPEVRGLSPVIGKNLLISNIFILSTVYWKDENKEKEAGNGPFFKKEYPLGTT